MKDSAFPLIESLENEAFILLRNPDFNVRISAVYLMLSLGSAIPLNASRYFHDALTNGKSQAKLLMTTLDDNNITNNITNITTNSATNINEKQKRIFSMHGQILLLSQLIKNRKELPSCLPNDFII